MRMYNQEQNHGQQAGYNRPNGGGYGAYTSNRPLTPSTQPARIPPATVGQQPVTAPPQQQTAASSGYGAYKSNNVMTASPQELTLMLYNGAIKFCTLSMENLEKKDITKAHNYNVRAQDIINELRITLDKKYPIAEEMDVLYRYILQLLVEGNINKDPAKVAEARHFITEFRDTWKQIIGKTN